MEFVDIASGGMHPLQQITPSEAIQTHFALVIKKALTDTELLVSAVDMMSSEAVAQSLMNDEIDLITVEKGIQKNPGLIRA